MKIYSTGEVCRRLGIQSEKLFYMERTGKIGEAKRLGNGKRFFTEADLRSIERVLVRMAAHNESQEAR